MSVECSFNRLSVKWLSRPSPIVACKLFNNCIPCLVIESSQTFLGVTVNLNLKSINGDIILLILI